MSKKFLSSKTPTTPKPRLSDEMKKDVIYKVCVASLVKKHTVSEISVSPKKF